MTPTCVGGVCGEKPLADGTTCDGASTRICVAGACVDRGCGDGYREPGPLPAREGCDDGNFDTGDACSPTCTPTPLVVAAHAEGADLPPGGPTPAAGVDATGRVLLVWKRLGDSSYPVMASLHSPAGVPLAPTIEVAAGFYAGWDARPGVVGLDEGWVVAWTSPTIDGNGAGIAYRVIRPDGTQGPVLQANTVESLGQNRPSLARTPTGFVAAWADESELGPAHGIRVRGRMFADDGTPAGPEIDVHHGGSNQLEPVVAASGECLLFAWTAMGDAPGAASAVLARRLHLAGIPIDPVPLVLSDDEAPPSTLGAFAPAAAPLADDGAGASAGFVVAWATRAWDLEGDVRARRVPATGPLVDGPETVAGEPGAGELMPSVAALDEGGYIVLYHRASSSGQVHDVELEPVPGLLAPEAPSLAALLHGAGAQQTGSVVSAPAGLWFAWSDDALQPGAPRAFVAYLLARD